LSARAGLDVSEKKNMLLSLGFEPRTVQHGTVDFPFPELHTNLHISVKGSCRRRFINVKNGRPTWIICKTSHIQLHSAFASSAPSSVPSALLQAPRQQHIPVGNSKEHHKCLSHQHRPYVFHVRINVGPSHCSGGQSLASHSGDPRSNTGQ
jgi:hypothetical protein